MAEPRWNPARERGQRERFRQWKEWVTEKRRLCRLGRVPPGERPHKEIIFVNEDSVGENGMLTRE